MATNNVEANQHSNNKKGLQEQQTSYLEFQKLFEDLGLIRYFNHSTFLSLRDALAIKEDTLNVANCTNLKHLPWLVLQKIMAYDYQSRTNLLTSVNANTHSNNDSDDDEESDSDSDEESYDFAYNQTGSVHPLDVILALFHCADDFLRQDMMVRLSNCQMAIPFVLRDSYTQSLIFPFWALSSIVKSWRTKDSDGKCVDHEHQIINCSLPIVCFIRLGMSKHKISKSKLLNEVISNAHHDHFFQRECSGGGMKRFLGHGLIDMCFYLPNGKEDVFPSPVIFLNLHGSSCHELNQTQLIFLSKISSMCFALVHGHELDATSAEVLKMFSDFTLLITGKRPKNLKEVLSKKVQTIKLKENAFENKAKIREQIKEKVFSSGHKISHKSLISCVEIARKMSILIDEDNETLVIGHGFASSLCKFVRSDQFLKKEALPLQGKTMWQEWARYDKEERRQIHRGEKDIRQYKSEIDVEKKKIRKLQIFHVTHLSPLMQNFINCLQTMDERVLNYYLQCVKLELNNLSRNTIAKVHVDYRETRLKLSQLQLRSGSNETESCKSEKSKLKNELDKLHGKLIDLAFGLEHLLREVAQIFETSIAQENQMIKQQFSQLPRLAAQLLIFGLPLEIMDGDAAHVPIEWVTTVLQETVSLLNYDPKIFILSVLGLQSTGKSTLLNTTFGLQFNVSSGRCTRGAYMQLLPISKSLSESVECDFLLVVDTEGLRAPELDSLQSQKHDNELATFVIGLANETLINIYGEVAGDMDDILQTAVHAFIRMREVDLKPSCQFVHQNAGAGTKTGIGRDRFIQKLNQMTCYAAKEEKCEHLFKQFSDVIKFDDQKDVHHFESLWMGDPPMAPVNTGYSNCAQSLKSHLIKQVRETHCTRLSLFSRRMADLWIALLHENFVFSFKNSVEIQAYNNLETRYSEWEWDLKNKVLQWIEETTDEIKAASESCDTKKLEQIINKKFDRTKGELVLLVNNESSKLEEKLASYFEQSKESDVIAQWRSNFERKLQEQAKALKQEALNHLEPFCQSKKMLSSVLEEKEKYIQEMCDGVNQVALKMIESGDELTEEKLTKTFQQFWDGNFGNFRLEHEIQNSKHVRADVEKELMKFLGYGGEKLITQTQCSHTTQNSSLKLEVVKGVHVQIKSEVQHSRLREYLKKKVGIASLDESLMHRAQDITDIVLVSASQFLSRIKTATYSPAYTTRMLNEIKEALTHALNQEKDLHFTRQYEADLYLTACNHAIKQFESMVERYNKENDPVAQFERDFKRPLEDIFRAKCKSTVHEKTIAETLSKRLVDAIEDKLKSSLGRIVVHQIKSPTGDQGAADISRYSIDFRDGDNWWKKCFKNKKALKCKILSDLGERGNFDSYKIYLTSPKQCFQSWATEYIREYCDTSTSGYYLTRLQQLTQNAIEIMIKEAEKEVDSLHEQLSPKCSTCEWLEKFSSEVIKVVGHVNVTTLIKTSKKDEEIDIKSFTLYVKDEFKKKERELMQKYKEIKMAEMGSWPSRPEIILGNMAGCCEQCPFCGEICDHTLPHGSERKHTVERHRPQCLAGWRDTVSEEMIVSICTSLVTGKDRYTFFIHPKTNNQPHQYSGYGTVFRDWEINGNINSDTSSYWKWFVVKYTSYITKHFNMLPPVYIPWNESWQNVKYELQKEYI